MIGGLVRLGRDRLLDEIDRRGSVAALQLYDAQKMERVGVLGLFGKDAPIDRLGRRRLAGTVQLARLIEALLAQLLLVHGQGPYRTPDGPQACQTSWRNPSLPGSAKRTCRLAHGRSSPPRPRRESSSSARRPALRCTRRASRGTTLPANGCGRGWGSTTRLFTFPRASPLSPRASATPAAARTATCRRAPSARRRGTPRLFPMLARPRTLRLGRALRPGLSPRPARE